MRRDNDILVHPSTQPQAVLLLLLLFSLLHSGLRIRLQLLPAPRLPLLLLLLRLAGVASCFASWVLQQYQHMGTQSELAPIWQQRSDRYSELRGSLPADIGQGVRRVEMSYIGG